MAPFAKDAVGWKAFMRTRAREQKKSDTPLSDDALADMLESFGFDDEAKALRGPDLASMAKAKGLVLLSQDEFDALSVKAAEESFVLELSDDPDQGSDEKDLLVIDAEAVSAAVRDGVRDLIGREMKSAINAMRGRLD